MNILNAISENPQYATAILAAIITALGTIIAAIINRTKHRKKKNHQGSQKIVTIPPPVDPLSHLRSNLGGIKDINNMDPFSDKYYQTLAARIAIQKNEKTIIKISRRNKHEL